MLNLQNKKLRILLIWLFILSIFLILALINATDQYIDNLLKQNDSKFLVEFFWKLTTWIPWFFLLPLLYYLCQKLPVYRYGIIKLILIHFPISLFITAIKVSLYYFLSLPLRSYLVTPTFFYKRMLEVLIVNYLADYLIYWLFLILIYAVDYYKKTRQKELQTQQLETQLARAQLQVLKMQLRPHFLFNALHTISALVHKNADLADKMITRLSDLLRRTLENTDSQLVSLAEEIEFVDNYLEIEMVRFPNRLKVEKDIQKETLNKLVPNLIIQPLVENSIKYCVAPYSRPGIIQIQAALKKNRLSIQVIDNGPGIKGTSSEVVRKGIGLSNIQERLKKLYGSDHRFELINIPEGGLIVNIEFPYSINL